MNGQRAAQGCCIGPSLVRAIRRAFGAGPPGEWRRKNWSRWFVNDIHNEMNVVILQTNETVKYEFSVMIPGAQCCRSTAPMSNSWLDQAIFFSGSCDRSKKEPFRTEAVALHCLTWQRQAMPSWTRVYGRSVMIAPHLGQFNCPHHKPFARIQPMHWSWVAVASCMSRSVIATTPAMFLWLSAAELRLARNKLTYFTAISKQATALQALRDKTKWHSYQPDKRQV